MAPSAKRILIAPLDWGLGHTTRCIPIIHALYALGQEVLFAGTAAQQSFIRRTFPDIPLRDLQGYQVRYSKRALLLTLLWQIPRLINIIKGEHAWLRKLIQEEAIDGIISDNRYGLWQLGKPSVILTHQLQIRSGMGRALDALLRKKHYQLLERFGTIWVPDQQGLENLGGELSHPDLLPRGTRYLGYLSQFSTPQTPVRPGGYILVLLSGPEPQRTILADLLWQQAIVLDRALVFVEGSKDARRVDVPEHVSHYSLIGPAELEPLLACAGLVVCRSGYSTLMDLAVFGKRAVLIPTPGQTEQEYLAKRLAKQGQCYHLPQGSLALKEAIGAAEAMPGIRVATRHNVLLPVLQEWITSL